MILAPQDALHASTKGASYLGGSGGMFPQEIFKIEHSETLFPSFLEREYPPPPRAQESVSKARLEFTQILFKK